ncbi:nuclear transport factor 2 family protein [Nocardia sp. NPDC020380]|uniref:nuclear transport factor 2 family protein n=1 Tax=Nocardia sp. NPDC020380 TaxID=3364309 RepID=UPI00378C9EF8
MAQTTENIESDEIRRWIDHAEITELINRYAKVFDERTFTAALPTLFIDDVHVELPPGDHRGIVDMDQFHAQVRAPFGCTQHILTNVLTEVDLTRAVFRANTYVTHVVLPATGSSHDEPDNLFVAGGILSGTTVRTAQGWRFQNVVLDVVWRSGDFGPPPPEN